MDIANDINGEFYVAGSQGERDEDKSNNHFIIPPGAEATFGLKTRTDTDVAGVADALKVIIRANFWYLVAGDVSHDVAWRVVYLRVLGLILGLADVANRPGAHNVVYNDVKLIHLGAETTAGDEGTREFVSKGADGAAVNVHPYVTDVPGWNDQVNIEWRSATKKMFTNIVCIVAFFFRTRGHHYMDDFDERYKAVWKKCLYEEETIGLAWQYVATHALHFVYPAVLDEFWRNACDDEHCAGALIKRVNSYAAGTAAVGAVWAGYADLIILFPKFRDTVKEAVAELERCRNAILNNRWVGSVNRRYYGADNLTINESTLSSLAATILQALKNSTGNVALKESKALIRVAGGAPITGTFMATILAKAANHDDMVYAILPDENLQDIGA